MRFAPEIAGKLNSNKLKYIYFAVIGLLLSICQVTFLDIISIAGISPDLVLVLVVIISIAEGQFSGMFVGFGAGLIFDIISLDVIGTNALAKTVAGFIAGRFYKENYSTQIIGSYHFIFILLLVSIVHNLIYFFFYIRPSDLSFLNFFLKYGLASSLYTTIIGVFVMLVKMPKKTI